MTAVAVTVGAYIPFTSWDLVYQQPSHRTILANLLLVQNLVTLPSVSGPFWSLPYEVQMYLLLPVLFILLRKASLKPLIGIWIASIFFGLLQPWVAATRLGSHFYADRLGIAEFIPCFLVGVLAYQLSLRPKAPHLQFSTWAVSLGVMTIVYLLWESRVGYVGYPEWACCLPIGLVVVHCAECPHPRLNRWTHLIARYSYGIYLSQVSVLWLVFVKLRALPPAQKWSLFVFLIVALPVASYHLLEKPFIKIGKALTPSTPKIYETHLELFSRRKPEQMQDGV
jgi:peptidoglycan/LPS O-acetylase OafA/YrhL